jgi:hypothetical protein
MIKKPAKLGYLTTLKRRHSPGRLSRKRYLCQASARIGDLEELKALRTKDSPWDVWTCTSAARGGHLEVLKWARLRSCPWDE